MKADWASHPMPELVIETAGGASQAAQVADWTERATTATQAATHSHFILKMANSLIKGEDNGIAEIRLHSSTKKEEYFDLLQHMDDECTNQDFMKHMIGVALHAGAFLLDGESAADIVKTEGKVRKAYQELKYYMTGFNDQILKAARKAKPSAFTYANKNWSRSEPNPYQGIIVWHCITQGVSKKKDRKKLDDLRKRMTRAVESQISRAVDVHGFLQHINEIYQDYVEAGGTEESAAEIILPNALRSLSDGALVYDRVDTKEWRSIGEVAKAGLEEWQDGGYQAGKSDWEIVLERLTIGYNDVFDDVDAGSRGTAPNGPAPHKNRAKFPMGVSFAAVEGESGPDLDSQELLVMAAYDKPASSSDYRALMERKIPLPGTRLIKQDAAAPGEADGKKKGQKAARPDMPNWTCGQKKDDGTECGYSNFYYHKPMKSDYTIKTNCNRCRKPKLVSTVAAPRGKPTVNADKKVDDQVKMVTEKVMAAVTEQLAELKGGSGTAMAQVEGNGFQIGETLGGGAIGMANAAIKPNFDSSVFCAKDDVGMACAAIPLSGEQVLPRRGVNHAAAAVNYVAGTGAMIGGATCLRGLAGALINGIREFKYFLAFLITLAAIAMTLADPLTAPRASLSRVNLNAFGLNPIINQQIRRTSTQRMSALGSYITRAAGMMIGGDDNGVSASRAYELGFASTAGFTADRLFLDSCCSRTIIHDKKLLTNIRPLRTPKSIMGIGGYKRITQAGDLQLRMTDVQGRTRTVTVRDVYYDPSLAYNLVSVSDMCREQYASTFAAEGSMLTGPEGTFQLEHTSDVYALPTADESPTSHALGALGRMSPEEVMHLRLNHAVSPQKLAILSNSGARGIPSGLQEHKIKCQVCQHANCTRSDAAPAATGSDPFDMSFDMVDMSSIPTIGGKRYCTIFVMRKTRFVYTFLHEQKTDFPAIFDKLMSQFTDEARPKILKCDGAGEYDSKEFHAVLQNYPGTRMQHSNAHEQSANGMAEKMVDRLGRMLRATLLQSQMPPEFWGAATILMTDIYNCTPHSALNGESPYFRHKGVHPDLSFFRPFGCTMVVHQGKDLVEHHKLAPRGEKCVYLGCGMAFGRRAFIAYSPRLNRIFCTIHAQFDETHFPFRPCDQRVRGYLDNDAQLESLSLFHDMPNATMDELRERIANTNVPCDTEWSLADLMQLPATLHPATSEGTGDSGDCGDSGDSWDSGPTASDASQPAGSSGADATAKINNVSLRQAQKSVFVHGRPAPYAEMAPTWQAAGSKNMKEVSNHELAEYLIGTDAEIKCPPSFWPKDKCSWTVRCVEHNPDGRAKGGHRFKVLLIHSEPAYKGAGSEQTWEATVSAWHIREAIRMNHGGDHKTLERMFDPKYTSIGEQAIAAVARLGQRLMPARKSPKLKRVEAKETSECAGIGMAWAAAICEEGQHEFAGVRPVPRSYFDIAGRPDAEAWYRACDVELDKLFSMGTFDIVDEAGMPSGTRIMDTCFSFKRKEDSQGNLKELRCSINADGRQQIREECGDTFAPTSKFSCIRTICSLAAQEGLTLYQFDIKGAFLMAPCKEDIYLRLPGRYRLPKGKVLKLRKYIYGLRQSASHWHKLFASWLEAYSFENIDSDGVTWVKNGAGRDGVPTKLLLTVHVDDGLAACNDPEMYQEFLEALRKDFDLSDCGELSWLLGCKVEQEAGKVRLHQEKYCTDILKRFQHSECKPISTQCEPNMHLSDADCPRMEDRDPEVIRNYQALVGALMYLTCFTRGDCSFAVNQCARFMSNPGPSHIKAARRVLRYLAGTRSLGITYTRDARDASLATTGRKSEPNQLTASADADHAGGKDRRSVSGWAVMMNGAMVTWSSKRQPVTAISSTESEFYAVSQCALDCVYLRRVMELMGYKQKHPTFIAQDKAACIYIIKGSGMYNRAKHIDTRIYRIRELSTGKDPEVDVYKIAGEYQPADIFTKGLPRVAFERHRATLMGEVPQGVAVV